MDLLSLKYFLVTAQTQHMTKAAEILNITQPALSAFIKRMENELGCQLFVREGRGIRLSKYGEILMESALQIDQIMKDCTYKLNQAQMADHPEVRIACSAAPSNEQMLSILMSDNITVNAQWIPPDWDIELLGHQLDFVLTFGQTKQLMLSSTTLCYYEIVIVASRSHPLCQQKKLFIKDLNHAQFCCNSARHSLTHVLCNSGIIPGFTPQFTFQGRTMSDLLRQIRTGRHLCIMVKDHLPDDPELVILPVNDFCIKMPFYLYWNQTNTNPFLLKIKESIIEFYDKSLNKNCEKDNGLL